MAENSANPSDHRFRPHEHLRRPAEFRRVYDLRRSSSNDWLIVYAAPNERAYSRLGMSVSRKYGGAVQRNRLRRLYREAFRLGKGRIPTGLDLVLIPRGTDEPKLADLLEALPKLVGQIAKKLAQQFEQSRGAEAMIAGIRNLLSGFLVLGVRGYQICIRPLLPATCRYQPSCSEYFIQSVRKYGPLSGAWRGTKRICRCNPWSRGGYDPP